MEKNISAILALETFMQERMYVVRGVKVLPDTDIAVLYETDIAELHRIVSINKKRFPPDFMFLLNEDEKKILSLTVEKACVFTWGGILMLGGQLKSSRAIRTHMQLIEVFVDRMPGKVFEILSEINQKK